MNSSIAVIMKLLIGRDVRKAAIKGMMLAFMLIIEGETYFTNTDAEKIFGVSTKTVRSYIDIAINSDPPEIQYGLAP
jgi:hypothetical protein